MAEKIYGSRHDDKAEFEAELYAKVIDLLNSMADREYFTIKRNDGIVIGLARIRK